MARVRVRKTNVTLEAYEFFLKNPNYEGFSYEQLNQFIYLHGFKKIHRRRKNELYEALSAIDKLTPERSTLNEKLSPYNSSLALDQVKQDLDALNWQECSVQSVQALNPTDENACHARSNGCNKSVSKDILTSSFKISRKRGRRSRRKKKVVWRSIENFSGGADVDTGVTDGCEAEAEAPLFVDTYRWEF